MEKEEIYKRVKDIFIEEFELEEDELTPAATLYDELELDSLDAVDLVVALEKEIGVKMRGEEAMREVRTIDDLVNLIQLFLNKG
ncbi:MAG: acyl carrier protein [Thermodesulfobacteriota bacterium]